MKTRILSSAVLVISLTILSITAFAQNPGGSSNAGGGGPVGGSVGGTPAPGVSAITFDFGASGVFSIPSGSPYFATIQSVLTYLHATIDANGLVTFPTVSCYQGCLLPLYYTGCINYRTYQTCKSQPPVCNPPSCTPPPTSCH